jgi:hypothetical protein
MAVFIRLLQPFIPQKMKKRLPKTLLFLLLLMVVCAHQANAFCGFYVATTDVALTNKASQVIMVRDGDHTVITMSSDYSGDAKDFAMVVPVPEVLRESDIRVVQQYIFDKFSQYTAPRMVEYWDQNPCPQPRDKYYDMSAGKESLKSSPVSTTATGSSDIKKGVTVEAKYVVGEYDILILSATESSGLKDWLTENGYKIPAGAGEVLDPYIKDGMKFFVVKVNLEQQKALGMQTLRPLQIQFDTPKFMLPIRLGMANATSAQDMVVYAFTRKGRVETANYRTTKLPTDRDIPEFVQTDKLFGDFYKSTFERAWAHEGKNAVMLEYAWDISAQQPVKCDPCAGPQITFAELREAGVWWITPDARSGGYGGDLFVTRLHVRYSRATFPQDLMFLNTPDNSRFQGRYVIHHKAQGSLDCPEGKRYLADLRMRRQKELQELAALTGWSTTKWSSYLGAVVPIDPVNGQRTSQASVEPDTDTAATVSADPVTPSTPASLVDEQQSVAASNAYLQQASAGSGGLGTRTWLFILAVGMFVAGILVRVIGRKGKQNPGDATRS